MKKTQRTPNQNIKYTGVLPGRKAKNKPGSGIPVINQKERNQMGQCYDALVINEQNKVACLSPYNFDEYFKLMEHSWIGNAFVNAAYALIRNHRGQVAWIGEYAMNSYDPEKDAFARAMPRHKFEKYYDLLHGPRSGRFVKQSAFSSADLELLTQDTKGMFLLDHSKSLFIDLEKYMERSTNADGWCVNPLPLLTACGNNRGGGDFRAGVGFEHVGTWAFDWLEYTDHVPECYTEFPICFLETSKKISLSAFLEAVENSQNSA